MSTTLLISLTVPNFDAWQTAFDNSLRLRTRHGCIGSITMRTIDARGHHVIVLLDFPGSKAARAFATEMRAEVAALDIGIVGKPTFDIVSDA
jgi:hypothetical protein